MTGKSLAHNLGAGDAGEIPGAKVEIEQQANVQVGRKTEERAIARSKPKYNN